jgi:rhamnose utilization protein RhaD (predicted bifunctional aldolase and dehydrogenase)
MTDDLLTQLVAMSNRLGQPELDYVILGEGNTSAHCDAETFWVKGSGQELRTMGPAGFVRVRYDRALALLDAGDLTDADVKAGLTAAKADPSAPAHPSVETMLHALCLQLPGVNFVAHTHATTANMLTCSQAFDTAFSGRLFPDEIVVCGVAPLLIPYTDPGVILARKFRELLGVYLDTYGETPKTVYMQNHGLIALGSSPQHVESITAMAVKTARVLLGTFAAGGPHFLTAKDVARIHTRPDELYRRQSLKLN